MLKYPLKSHRKSIAIPEDSEKLAELFGIIFGDGGINNDWQLVISLNSEKDQEYSVYISNLINELFNIKVVARKRPRQDTLVLVCSSMNLLDFLISKGAIKGNKIAQNIDIPQWISSNEKYEKTFVRGLMDTDGGLYTHNHFVNGKPYHNLGLCFTSYSQKLLSSISSILIKNNVKPYIKNNGTRIYLYSYKAIEKYLEMFGSNNLRIKRQYSSWRDAGVV